MRSVIALQTIFLRLHCGGRPVAGEAALQGFEAQIGIASCRWTSGAEHRAAGRDAASSLWHGRLHLRKRFDRSSTALYGHMKNHDRIDSAWLTLLDPGLHEQPSPLAELHMQDCFIEQISAVGSDTGDFVQVNEDIALSFDSGLLRYYPRPQPGAARLAPTDYHIPLSRHGG